MYTTQLPGFGNLIFKKHLPKSGVSVVCFTIHCTTQIWPYCQQPAFFGERKPKINVCVELLVHQSSSDRLSCTKVITPSRSKHHME